MAGRLDEALAELKSADAKVRKQAIERLDQFGSREAVPGIRGMLRDRDGSVRIAAICALDKFNDLKSFKPLLSLAKSPEPRVRALALACASLRSPKESLGTLSGFLKNERDWRARCAVIWLVPWKRFGKQKAAALLMKTLTDPSCPVREVSLAELGWVGDRKCAKKIASMLRDTCPAVRSEAANALGYLLDRSTVPQLLDALQDENIEVRKSAALTLGWVMGELRAVPQLLGLLSEGDEEARHIAIIGIGKIAENKKWKEREGVIAALRKAARREAEGSHGRELLNALSVLTGECDEMVLPFRDVVVRGGFPNLAERERRLIASLEEKHKQCRK